MIITFTGLTGHGKTFIMSKMLYKEWQLGAEVNVNFPVIFSEENERVKYFTNLSELYHLHNGIIAIDEAQKLLDARRWSSLPLSFAEKIAQHRKHFLDIYTTTQDLGHIDVRMRSLIHVVYHCQSILRLPANERVYPLFQIIRVVRKERKHSGDNERIMWTPVGKAKYYFISRFWTKKIYETYADVGLNKFICRTKLDKKKWLVKIYSRDLVNSGKARLG